MNKIFLFLILCIASAAGQELRNPFDFPIRLAGNFGELRSNHFHSGIDFKTQGVEGKPVHAVQEGHVARIAVSPWGYGNVLYLEHPDGTTTVYAHLQRFAPKIAAYVKEQQYALERFAVDLTPAADRLPVGAGEVIALSGNTGSSAGPHLHFEVRDTETEEVLDPLPYYRERIRDTRPPKILGLLACPAPGKGVVNGKGGNQRIPVVTGASGKPAVQGTIRAWGEVGFAIRANDYMDETANIYGVREISLTTGEDTLFHSDLDRFAFDETRYLNSFTDYAEWKERHAFYIRSFLEPGNRLRFLHARRRGMLRIDEERTYALTYTLSDLYGNTTRLTFHIIGEKQPLPEPAPYDQLFHWNSDNRFGAKGIRLTIPRGNLYADLPFRYETEETAGALAPLHRLHDRPVPLHAACPLSLRLQHDTLPEKRQYGIVRQQGGRRSWIGGTYRNGWIDGSIKELGSYTLAADCTPPAITPLEAERWRARRQIRFRLTDDLSGVARYRGEIDGQYALFEMDARSVITCRLDNGRWAPGEHTLRLTVTDAAGNVSTCTRRFVCR